MKVARWGNSLAIRLPRRLVESMALKDGDDVELVQTGERRMVVARDRRRDEALARITLMRWQIPENYAFDRDGLHEREDPAEDQAELKRA